MAVARDGSFRAAGLNLGLSPIGISEHIRALEDRLGRELFTRSSGSPARLTNFGSLIVSHAKDVLWAAQKLEDAASDSTATNVWTLCISPFLARHLAGRINELRNRFPERELVAETVDISFTAGVTAIRDGKYDLVLTIADSSETREQMRPPDMQIVIDEPLALFAAHDHPLARSHGVEREELLGQRMAMLGRDHPLRDVVDKCLARAGLGMLGAQIETDDYNEILREVSRSQAIACLFADARSSDTIAHRLQMLQTNFHLPSPQVVMLASDEAQRDRKLQVAADFLANHYRFDATAARREIATF